MRILNFNFFLILSLLTVTSCKKSDACHTKNSYQACDDEVVHFERDVLPILIGNCTGSGCHNTADKAGGLSLMTYNDVNDKHYVKPCASNRSHLFEHINSDKASMQMPPPPYAKMDPLLIDKISLWIDQGALDMQCNDEIVLDTIDVSFSNDVLPLLMAKCYGCHNEQQAGSTYLVTNYEDVRTMAESNRLMGSLDQENGYSSMPKNGPKLSSYEIALIRNWISEGMLNN